MERESIISLSQRRDIAKNFVIEAGTEVKYQVLDVTKLAQHIVSSRRKNKQPLHIDILPISEDVNKNISRMPSYQKDPITGVLYGLFLGETQYGSPKWQKPHMTESTHLDLNNINDAKMWTVLQFYPEIKGTPFQVSTPHYKLYDPMAIAKERNTRVSKKKIAFEYVNEIKKSITGMIRFCRYIGKTLIPGDNEEILEGYLLEYADEHPNDFIAKYKNPRRGVGEFFASARECNVITFEPGKGFYYKSEHLGERVEDAIAFLGHEENLTVAGSITQDLKEADKVLLNLKK